MDQQIKKNEDSPLTGPLSALLSNTYTKNDAVRRLRLISELLNYKIFKQDPGITLAQTFENFKKQFEKDRYRSDFESDMDFLAGLPESFYNYFSPTQINIQLKDLSDKINSANIVLIYIPFEIPEPERVKMGRYFKQNFGPLSLFDIIYDPALIGGCALSFKGVYKDYSLRAKILANEQAVLKELTAYKKQQ